MAEQKKQRRRLLVLGGALAVVVALIVSAVALLNRPDSSAAMPTGEVTFADQSRGHVAGTVNYSVTPPVGGDHAAVWENCGIYTEPIPNEPAVHSLEHGAFWITYQPELPADQITALQNAVRNQPYGLLSPMSGLPAPVVASAWGVQLKLDSANDPRLARFVAAHADGSKAPEPRGECTGGVGSPQA
ncbi:MAG: DUF3105 domain-containing protein [Propionibacteriaceae bacterium]|nr:DUF3105 domain-containing protein [Propionibacteriaceae bacterium]